MAFYQNPSSNAESTLNQIPSMLTTTYQPYLTAGQQSLNTLENQAGNLINNNYKNLQNAITQMLLSPGATLNKIGAGYHESPGYQWEVREGTEAANNAADAGGYSGTPQDQQYQAEMTEGIADNDYENWLRDTLGIGRAGLSGAGKLYSTGLNTVENLNNQGFSATNSLAEGLAQYLTALSNEQYASAVNKNQHNMGLLGDTLGAVIGLGHYL